MEDSKVLEKDNDESIILSEKHGVNPSIEVCFLCQKDMGIIMFGKLKDDAEAPRQVCMGRLCEDCLQKLKEEDKYIFISESGKYVIVNKDGINPEIIDKLDRVTYMTEQHFTEIFS